MTKARELLLGVWEDWDDKKYMKWQGGQAHSNSSNRLTPGNRSPARSHRYRPNKTPPVRLVEMMLPELHEWD